MENCTKFNDLEAHLRELFKSASYSESTVKDMDFILRAFTNYMNANGMEEYSPEIGEILIHYCRETLKVCDSRVSRAKVIVGKLNRLYQGLDGEEALWADKIVPVELPDSLSRALDSFISHCRHKGNKETTLHYKRWICSRFLKNLEMLGCQSLQSINGELIQSAFLQLGYLRYWERIGPFLRYLFESGQIQRDFSKLIVNRKKFSPQPTVYTQEEVAAIEDSVDCTTAAGVRNYAILLLLSRYGIRSRDIAALSFENLDFENDRIHFTQQKTGDLWEMELFPEVKAALQDYILTARPKIQNCQNVFLTTMIPYKPLDSYAINTAVDQHRRDPHERGACLHCFRHLFVLKSMQQLESAGHSVDVNDLLLPTYLGHECLLDTDKYMRFSGVQVPESLDVFETFTAGLIPNVEVSYEEE